MKKSLALIISAALSISMLGACTAEMPEETVVQETTTVQTAEAQVQTQVPLETGDDSTVPADMLGLFAQAMDGFVGVNYEPCIYLGELPDVEDIHCFLCRASVVVPNAVPYWALVYVYDNSGNAAIFGSYIPDYAASCEAETAEVSDNTASIVPGGWETTADLALTDELNSIFVSTEGTEGYEVYGLLASQVVSGMNYCYIASDGSSWYLVYIYADLQGNSEVTNISHLDLSYL